MAGTLREELASLKIDRPDPMNSATTGIANRRAAAAVAVAAAAFVDALADPAGSSGGRRRLRLSPVRSDAVPAPGDARDWWCRRRRRKRRRCSTPTAI